MTIFTIGFTKKPAEAFFNLLKNAGVETVIDVRANNTSQLAGFAKKPDVSFFLREILNVKYVELAELAPDALLLKKYRSSEISWDIYAERYIADLARRRVETFIDSASLQNACLLCSEHEPLFCHRRLAVEYLNNQWASKVDVRHLK